MKTILMFLCVAISGCGFKANSLSETLGGDTAGNGGEVVVCTNQTSVELLDTYEARVKHNQRPDFGAAQQTLQQRVENAVRNNFAADLIQRERYLGLTADFFAPGRTLFLSEIALPDIPDSGGAVVPRGCHTEQIAIQLEPILTTDPYYNIDKDLWDRMSEDNKAVLVLHEILYRARLQDGDTDSRKARLINGYVMSNDLSKMTGEQYAAFWDQIWGPDVLHYHGHPLISVPRDYYPDRKTPKSIYIDCKNQSSYRMYAPLIGMGVQRCTNEYGGKATIRDVSVNGDISAGDNDSSDGFYTSNKELSLTPELKVVGTQESYYRVSYSKSGDEINLKGQKLVSVDMPLLGKKLARFFEAVIDRKTLKTKSFEVSFKDATVVPFMDRDVLVNSAVVEFNASLNKFVVTKIYISSYNDPLEIEILGNKVRTRDIELFFNNAANRYEIKYANFDQEFLIDKQKMRIVNFQPPNRLFSFKTEFSLFGWTFQPQRIYFFVKETNKELHAKMLRVPEKDPNDYSPSENYVTSPAEAKIQWNEAIITDTGIEVK